jgi:6-phosphofructokinase
VARIGVLNGGGDCPGLNAVIRAVVRKGVERYGDVIVGFRNGYRGLLDWAVMELTPESARGILHRGGTILGTSRVDPYLVDGGIDLLKENLDAYRIRGLIVIDNDLAATDYTFGFDTAVQVATDAIDRLHTTAESHNRVMVLEVMGRHTGWIGLYSGLAGGADVILIPEQPFDIEEVCDHIRHRHGRGHLFSIVVVSEGALPKEGSMEVPPYEEDEFGRPRLGGISNIIATEIQDRTGYETRVTILGHIQRGGSPSSFDRVLATRYGVAAIDLASEGTWGRMVALRGTRIEDCPLDDAVAELKRVPQELYEVAEVFFG